MFVIITSRSLIWLLLSLTASLIMLSTIVSPSWLIGKPTSVTFGNETINYTPSVGVYAKCSKPIRLNYPLCTTIAVRGLNTHWEVFPIAWKVSLMFLSCGLAILTITVFSGLISFCFQSVFRKSIFTISGTAQAIAGMFFIVGFMIYPMAWGEPRVQKLCGGESSPFYPGDCNIGMGLWLTIISTGLTFVASCLSVVAEKATSSDKVQDKIYDGHTLICLL